MSSLPAEKSNPEGIFSAQDYFLGIAQNILAAQKNALVTVPGMGEIYLLPKRNMFYANVPDMEAFCQLSAGQFKVQFLDETWAIEQKDIGAGKDISELMWQSAFHASQGNMIDSCSKFDVVEFTHWPNLTRLPHTSNTMRICALFTRHSVTIMLAHRMLGISKAELYQTYSAAYCAGITNAINHARNPEIDATETITEDTVQGPSLLQALFSKISGL